MKSKLLKIITDANKRIYLKIFFLDDKTVDYLINAKNIDIKVSIQKNWINTNCEFIEKLFKNEIPIFIYDDNESFVIVDDQKIKLDYIEENVKEYALKKLINKNFKNTNLYSSTEVIYIDKVTRLINEIKDEFRLISFSKTGIKIHQRKINFASLLKKQSKQEAIADEEKFELYDKEFLNNELKNRTSISEDEFDNLKKEYDNLIKICSKFNAFGDNIKTKYSCGKFDKFILVEKNYINNITKDINEINNINKNINEQYFNSLMDNFYENFNFKLQKVLKRHYVETNAEVENFKIKTRDNLPKAETIKEKIKIDNFMILELSREMLLDEKVIGKLKSFHLSDNIKEKLNQLENLIKEIK